MKCFFLGLLLAATVSVSSGALAHTPAHRQARPMNAGALLVLHIPEKPMTNRMSLLKTKAGRRPGKGPMVSKQAQVIFVGFVAAHAVGIYFLTRSLMARGSRSQGESGPQDA